MLAKKNHHLFLILFFVCIFSVPVFWAARGVITPQRSLIEGRTLRFFPAVSVQDLKTAVKRLIQGKPDQAGEVFFDQFLERKYQTIFEKAASDQMPLRLPGIQTAKALDRVMIEVSYSTIDDPAIPTDTQSSLYIMRDMPVIINGVSKFSSSSRKAIDQRIANYDELIKGNPDLNFYLFYHQRLTFSEFHPLNKLYSNPDSGRGIAYFEENKPEELTLGKFLLTSFDDHIKYYYRTDHHWNIRGAVNAYEIIYEMLAQNYSDISPKLQINDFYVFPDIKYLGSWDRESFYPMEGEEFEVAIVDLPSYRILQDGKDFAYNHSAEYLAGQYSTKPYENHYGNYYGEQTDILEYVFDNESDRNLLVIGSSFTRPLQPLLASHYHQTYIVDLRNYKDFTLSEFRLTHQVDDVLIIGDNLVAFQDLIWTINP